MTDKLVNDPVRSVGVVDLHEGRGWLPGGRHIPGRRNPGLVFAGKDRVYPRPDARQQLRRYQGRDEQEPVPGELLAGP